MPFKKQLEKPHRALIATLNDLPKSSKIPYNVKEMLQKYQDKVASIEHRRRWHSNIQRANYINEYNRLRGILDRSRVQQTGGPVHSRIRELAILAGINQ